MRKLKLPILFVPFLAVCLGCTNNPDTSGNTGDSTIKSENKMSEHSGSEDSMKTGGAVKRDEK